MKKVFVIAVLFLSACMSTNSESIKEVANGKSTSGCNVSGENKNLGKPENEITVGFVVSQELDVSSDSRRLIIPLDKLDLHITAITPEGETHKQAIYTAKEYLSGKDAVKSKWILDQVEYIDQLLKKRGISLNLNPENPKSGDFDLTITQASFSINKKPRLVLQVDSDDKLPSGSHSGVKISFNKSFPLAHINPLVYQDSDPRHYYPCSQGGHCDCCFGSTSNCKCWYTETSLGKAYGGCCPTPSCLRCISPVGNCPCNCC